MKRVLNEFRKTKTFLGSQQDFQFLVVGNTSAEYKVFVETFILFSLVSWFGNLEIRLISTSFGLVTQYLMDIY